MNKYWKNAMVSEIIAERYIPAGAEETIKHHRRPYHGFVLNGSDTVIDYYFADGSVKRAGENTLFFLPENSGYDIKSISGGGCYVIDFKLQETGREKPFVLEFRNHHDILKLFRESVRVWQLPDCSKTLCIKNLYEIIMAIEKELDRKYIPNDRGRMIELAIEEIHARFADHSLSVAELAGISGLSEVHFRRLFNAKTGINPREYITRQRMEYAKQLLESGEMSVAEVAESCGYIETGSFSREFARHEGISPLEYRKNIHDQTC